MPFFSVVIPTYNRGKLAQRKALKRELVGKFLEAFGVSDERPVSLLYAQDS
ncbi:glycosyltransferase [Corallococcus macrosporus]|uniref:DHH domain-containing protein n=1 Tax=Myxococcus fulvus (strain ATCC BAA-855 / HW-1) TaxID=483219 RepID=F8CK51_MYXFH|nr:glycosyltransferase [Corallococcus macrosporus]AEI66427.1 DHH domain-containing protein [Corallococcus macrosporus]